MKARQKKKLWMKLRTDRGGYLRSLTWREMAYWRKHWFKYPRMVMVGWSDDETYGASYMPDWNQLPPELRRRDGTKK